jgi:hypothetical protein
MKWLSWRGFRFSTLRCALRWEDADLSPARRLAAWFVALLNLQCALTTYAGVITPRRRSG